MPLPGWLVTSMQVDKPYQIFSRKSDKFLAWQVLETLESKILESKIFAFPFANHLWLDLNPIIT